MNTLTATPHEKVFRWDSFLVITAIHLLSIAAFFTFSWAGLGLFLIMSYVTGGFGITMGYHRLLTHRSFKTPAWVKYLLTFVACLSLQGGPIFWVGTHRVHHKTSDTPDDPHSPESGGFWWSHLLWNFYKTPDFVGDTNYKPFVQDLLDDKGMVFFEKTFFIIYLLFAALVFAAGNAIGGIKLGLSLVVWGCLLRTVYTWHVTWLVNSATHLWGYRNYKSNDTSRNLWWVALLTFGEGWHNNHHTDQRSASHGHLWFEFDISYRLIQLFAKLGLVSDIVEPRFKRIAVKELPPQSLAQTA